MRINYREMFPFKVLVPTSGTFHMLKWWTHDRQHSIAVAGSLKALYKTWERILERHEDANPREYWTGAFAGPTKKIEGLHAKRKYTDLRREYQYWLAPLIDSYVATHGVLPDGVSLCNDYLSNWDPNDKRSSEDPEHNSCKRCFWGYKFDNVSDHELIIKTKDFRGINDDESKLRLSKAPPALPTETLYAATLGSYGVDVHDNIEFQVSRGYQDQSLFLFHGVKHENVPEEFITLVKKVDEERKARRLKNKEEYQKRRANKHMNEAKELEKVLKAL